jgi:predicted ArsR family transcriptional regulator
MADPSTVVIDGEQPFVALGVRSRRRLLHILRASGGPVGAAELAAAVALHVTTVRAHLRVLEAAGLVVRTAGPPTGPGRPRQFYAPAPGGWAGDAHRELAELLAGALDAGGAQGRRRAEQAGRRWAAREVPDTRSLPWGEAVEAVGELFGRVGFAPRRLGAEGYRVALEHCPFRDVARAHPEVVCTLHLGLLRGALSRLGLPEVAESAQLQPFVAPELCMAEIPTPRATGATSPRPTPGAVG